MRLKFLAVCLALSSFSTSRAATITQWNFQDAGGAGTNTPAIGTGTITHLGGVTHTGFNSGSGSSDSVQPGQAHQTTTYPAQGQASGTAGIRFAVNTTGYQNIVCTFDLRTSNTSSRWYQIRYTTDGVNFVNLGTPIRLERFNANNEEVGVGDFWNNQRTADFSSIPGVNNNPNFAFEVVSVFSPVAFTEFLSGTSFLPDAGYEAARNRQFGGASSNYSGNGTWRFDMVTVSGDQIVGGNASIVDQFVFYSTWGGSGSARDTTKQVYKQTGTPTSLGFANLINAAQGITGVAFEIQNLGNPTGLSASDFVVQESPTGAFNLGSNPPSGWAATSAPSVSVISGSGSHEVQLSWTAANSAKNRWLRVTVKATPNTGLAADQVFYVGHLLGETTGLATGDTVYTVAFADITPIRSAVGGTVNAGSIADIDKSGTVAFADISAMRANVGSQLSNITVP